MKRQKIEELLDAVELELNKARLYYKENKLASDQMQRTTATSWSSAGDREYAIGQEVFTKLNLEMLVNLRKELKGGIRKDHLDTIEPPCFVRIYIDGEDVDFYLVENAASIEGFRIASTNSPVGNKLLKKKKYDEYEILGRVGKIIGIE